MPLADTGGGGGCGLAMTAVTPGWEPAECQAASVHDVIYSPKHPTRTVLICL